MILLLDSITGNIVTCQSSMIQFGYVEQIRKRTESSLVVDYVTQKLSELEQHTAMEDPNHDRVLDEEKPSNMEEGGSRCRCGPFAVDGKKEKVLASIPYHSMPYFTIPYHVTPCHTIQNTKPNHTRFLPHSCLRARSHSGCQAGCQITLPSMCLRPLTL